MSITAAEKFWCCPTRGQNGPALVGDEFGGGRHGFDTALGDLAIMDVSWCQEQDEGPAFRIADSVELGVAAPLGAADAMGQGPPFPPPAQR